MALLKRKRVLAAKIETTSGSAESLTSAEASFNCYDIEIQNEIDMSPREAQGAFNMMPSVPGAYRGKVTFKHDLSWDGTATEPTWADTFLPACGLVKSSQTFYPKTEAPGSNVKTLTIGVYVDGMFKSIRGAAGNVKFNFPVGRAAFAEFEFTGAWVAPSDVAIISPTYPTASALRYATSTTTFNSVALLLENLVFDVGNEVMMRESPANVAGYLGGIITNRVPKVTCNPEAKLVATRDVYGQLLAMTEATLSWTLPGPTNSLMTFAAPKAQVVKATEGDRSNLVTDEIEFQLNRNGSTVDQEFSILFTAAS